MLEFFQVLAGGIAAGSSYALMGLAIVIIYKSSEVINFAQGEMALLVVFFTFMILESHGLPFYVAFPGALLFAVLLGCFMEFAVLRRAKKPNVLGMIIITIGLEMILMGVVSWKFGADPKKMPFPISPYDSLPIYKVNVNTLEVLTFFVAIAIVLVLFLFFRYSKLGVAMKAARQNHVAARLMGIRTNRVLMINWGISSFVGCAAGLLIAPATMQPHMMWEPMLKGFAAAMLGGMTSLPGSVIGAYIIGVIENLFSEYVSIEFESSIAFFIIVLVLCIKPRGLFARHDVKKV